MVHASLEKIIEFRSHRELAEEVHSQPIIQLLLAQVELVVPVFT